MSFKISTVTLTSIQFFLLLFTFHFSPLVALPNNGSKINNHYEPATTESSLAQQDASIGAHSILGNKNSAQHPCILDDHWKGKWFQTGYPQPIFIDNKSIGPKGICLEKAGKDKFLFFDAASNCHKCIVINERHRNVLQYKENQYCEDKDHLDTLCSQIPGDGPLFSLFRMDAQPIDCPFKGAPYTFTYNRGHGECRDPLSHIDECTENSRLLLRYHACPNVPKTESTIESLECVGDWKEGSNNYLIAKLDHHLARISHESHEEHYRCFLYERIQDEVNATNDGERQGQGRTIGYKVAQSGDASCTDISSSTDGARTLQLRKVEQPNVKTCRFPNWVLAHSWHTLDGKISVKTHLKNSTMQVLSEIGFRDSKMYSTVVGQDMSQSNPSLLSAGSRFICLKRFDISDRQVTITAKRTNKCKSETVCMSIYKRDHHVIEMKIRSTSGPEDTDCGYKNNKNHKPEDSDFYTTLVSASVSQRRCPQLGKYMSTKVTSAQGSQINRRDTCLNGGQDFYKTLVVGCGQRGTMEFHSKCSTHDPIVSSYMCHGSWEENGTGYFIASPLSRSSNSADRYCFIYSQTVDGLRVSRNSQTCRTNSSSNDESFWTFNLTVDGQCAEPLTGGPASINNPTQILLLLCTVFYSVITFKYISPMSSLDHPLSKSLPHRTLNLRRS